MKGAGAAEGPGWRGDPKGVTRGQVNWRAQCAGGVWGWLGLSGCVFSGRQQALHMMRDRVCGMR